MEYLQYYKHYIQNGPQKFNPVVIFAFAVW